MPVVEKEFNPAEPEKFSVTDLMVSLPRAILVEQRIFNLEIKPVLKDDKVEFLTIYRCESNSKVYGISAQTPKESLLKAANWLLSEKIVATIKTPKYEQE
jgi:hypothetical protein